MEDSTLDMIFSREEETFEEFQQSVSTLSSADWIVDDPGDDKAQLSFDSFACHQNQVCDLVKSNTKAGSSENTFNNEPRLVGDDGIEEEEEIPCEELDVGVSNGSQMMFADYSATMMPKVDNFIDTCDSGSSNGSSVSSVCSLSDLEVGGEEEQKEDKENAYHAIFSGSASCSDVLHEKDGRSSLLNDASMNEDTSLSADQCQENSEFNVTVLNQISESDQLPGEADERANSLPSVEARITNIAIRTKLLSNGGTNTASSEGGKHDVVDTEQCLSDKIETFALDEDFDYDNVVLTPKFLVDDRSESS